MEWLNYHHLLYFWVVAREGSIAAATRKLNLTQPTISTQLRQLEDSLGERLFEKEGRGLVLTEAGKIALRYADEIFALGRELRDTLRDRPTGRPVRVTIGIADVVPKLVAYRVLRPAFAAAAEIEMVCREGSAEALVAMLGQHEVDLVISDAPASGTPLRTYSQLLGESGTTFFAAPALANSAKKQFPQSIDGAPLLMPGEGTQLRRALELWLDSTGFAPKRVGEFDDLALMSAFGRAGAGIFPAPSAIEDELESQFNVRVVGRLPDVRQRFYAVSAERKIKNPIVSAITTAARREVFEGGSHDRAR
ncbi:MAG TPA: transcriptional activator NhaR [Thermoanaerobaculia bacterium]|nr:transcriptional activator NhaR [Thermoanaerobaculia bacterium]